jgi:hypothetical protein
MCQDRLYWSSLTFSCIMAERLTIDGNQCGNKVAIYREQQLLKIGKSVYDQIIISAHDW